MTDLAVTWPIVVLGSLSLAGCGFIVFWILLLRKFTKFYYRLVLWIALSEILVCAWMIAGYAKWDDMSEELCSAQGFFIGMFVLAVDAWILMISACLHNLVVGRPPFGILGTIIMHLLVWVPTFILALLPVLPALDQFRLDYEPLQTGWCWVGPEEQFGRFLLSYGPEWLIIGATITIYSHVAIMLRRPIRLLLCPPSRPIQKSTNAALRAVRGLRQLLLYPAVMLLVWIPCTTARVIEAVRKSDDVATSQVLTVCLPSVGLLLFFVFVLTADLKADCKTISNWWHGNSGGAATPLLVQADQRASASISDELASSALDEENAAASV